MTLKEFLHENKFDKTITILMFGRHGKMIEPMEFDNASDIKGELLKREYMEHNEEDDTVEIWIM